MSIFRPLNSSESNLYTIRCVIGAQTSSNSDVVLVDNDSTTKTTTALTAPTINNLPLNFRITLKGNNDYYELEYGKQFTSAPSIFITPKSTASNVRANDAQTTETIGANIVQLNTTAGVTNAEFCFRRAQDSTPVQAVNGFDILITGPVKLGVTTGNSNKGWGVGAGNDPSNVYTYLDVGVGTGAPASNSLTLNSSLVGVPDTVSSTSTAISTDTLVTLINADSATVLSIAKGTNGQIKYLVCNNGTADMTINANLNVNNNIKFNEVGESAILLFDTTSDQWSVVGLNGATIS